MKTRKGIILAGGSGTRLYPVTNVVLKTATSRLRQTDDLLSAQCVDAGGDLRSLVISTPQDTPRFEQLLGDGSQWGIRFEYAIQPRPEGLAQAFILGREFVGNDDCALVLGDNIFFGQELVKMLKSASMQPTGATVFAYAVKIASVTE